MYAEDTTFRRRRLFIQINGSHFFSLGRDKKIKSENARAMHMDPKEYPDPEVFRPERFLSAPGNRLQRDPSKVTFGFGRRYSVRTCVRMLLIIDLDLS